MKRSVLVIVLGCLLCAGTAMAAGFNIYEMGARATALGGAFTATADDASAVFYNPAGLAYLDEGWQVSGNLALIMPKSEFALATGGSIDWPGDATSETKDAVFPPGGLYLGYNTTKQWSFGLGVFTPFGLGVEWDSPETFPGRSIATNSQIQSYYISPVVTWHPVEGVAVSAGVHTVITHLKLERKVVGGGDLGSNLGDFVLEGTSNLSIGPAFAIMARPNDRFSFGINFKGGVTNKFENQDGTLSLASGSTTAAKVTGDLKFPSILSIGVRARASEKLAVMADYVFFDWSVFDKVKLDFDVDTFDTVLNEGYDSGHQWRFGLEYDYTERLDLLCGFVYDLTPQPVWSMGPLLPDADRRDYSLGVTYHMDNGFDLTAAYMLVDFLERSTIVSGEGQNPEGFDGSYRSIAHIPTFGVSKSF